MFELPVPPAHLAQGGTVAQSGIETKSHVSPMQSGKALAGEGLSAHASRTSA